MQWRGLYSPGRPVSKPPDLQQAQVFGYRGTADPAGHGNLPITQALVPFETQHLFDFSHG